MKKSDELKMIKVLIFFCACAVASAQFQSRFQQPQSSQYNQYQQGSNQETQQNQYQQQSARPQGLASCGEVPVRSPVSGSCDRYIECVNGTSEEKLCPDGLLFNTNARGYPCSYPREVQCLERSGLQEAQPTENCPHQFGYYKLGDARNCSGFRSCVNGVAYDFVCPEGLAFNSETYGCDWPDEVADCDVEAFIGFRCPEVPISRELGPSVGNRFYRSDVGCQKYFVCVNGKPRALTCGGDSAFDELTSSCVSADEVDTCSPELRDRARRNREDEQQRLAKELLVSEIPAQQRRRNPYLARN